MSRLYGCLSTYNTLLESGDLIVSFIEDFAKLITERFNKIAKFNYSLKNRRVKWAPFTEPKWQKACGLFRDGSITKFRILGIDESLYNETLKEKVYFGEDPCVIDLYIATNADSPDEASLIEFSISTYLFADQVDTVIQELFVNWLSNLCSVIGGAGGLITIWGNPALHACSPPEVALGLTYGLASLEFNRYFRGHFWGNYLSPSHIQLLGGKDEVHKSAPAYRLEDLSDGSIYLQLTENINDVSEEHLDKLKLFLKPILREERPIEYPS